MPFTADELSYAGKVALDFYLENNPTDNVSIEHPMLKALQSKKKEFPGGKQYVVEQLRYKFSQNFSWFNGDAEVTYNKKQTITQAQYNWRAAHDGYSLNEDELFQNGISIVEGKGGDNTDSERLQLTNLLDENNESLRLGFEYQFDYELHQDGTQSTDAPGGLDSLISTTPTVGTVGGIDRSVAANSWWRNYAQTAISTATAGNLLSQMEIAWRACSRNGGKPDLILAGETFIDAYRKDAEAGITRFLNIQPTGGTELDAGVTGLQFHGVPIMWDPILLDLDTNLAPAIPWQKRCYFINSKFIRLRPAQGHDMKTRQPPRVYNRYAYYYGLTWRGALTMGRGNAHAVLSVA